MIKGGTCKHTLGGVAQKADKGRNVFIVLNQAHGMCESACKQASLKGDTPARFLLAESVKNAEKAIFRHFSAGLLQLKCFK